MKQCIYKGIIVYAPKAGELKILPGGYLYTKDGSTVTEVYENRLPECLSGVPVKDFGSCFILPGMTDLHIHAPQYGFRGFAMGLELIDWLNQYAFPEEEKFSDLAYADRAYGMFTEELKKSFTTRACIFATVHTEATLLLMKKLEESGLCTMVGKVNQDRNSAEGLQEISAGRSLEATRSWLEQCAVFQNTKPILTPRFIPSCTDELMEGLAKLKKEQSLFLQSHLSENPEEVHWVKELCPDSRSYAEAYLKGGALGGEGTSILAHCVYSGQEEIEVLRKTGTYVAHCPQSNWNLSSGIAPVRKFLDAGLNVGLGTDVAGGAHMSMLRCMTDAVQTSKMYWRIMDSTCRPLTYKEVFYLATKGGGSFFGKVGSFEKGYDLDMVVIDDSTLVHPQELTEEQRLERIFYLADERNIIEKYVKGREII